MPGPNFGTPKKARGSWVSDMARISRNVHRGTPVESDTASVRMLTLGQMEVD